MPKIVNTSFKKVDPNAIDDGLVIRIQETLEDCAERLNYTIELPKVLLDLEGRTAGLAYYRQNKIRLNSYLLKTNTEDMISDTLPHEFAHIVARHRYGNEYGFTPHGHRWKQVMRELGLEPKRCHQYAVKPAKVHQKFEYGCDCHGKTFKVGKNVHGKLQASIQRIGRTDRYCRDCRAWIHKV